MTIDINFYRTNAIRTEIGRCFHGHEGCSVENFVCAIQTYGGASHKMEFSHHTSNGDILSAARPYCGSRRTVSVHSGAFVKEVTCKKC